METKEELLEYAKKYYPSGTKYKDPKYHHEVGVYVGTSDFKYYDANGHSHSWITDGHGGAVYYADKGWSKIIKYPDGFIPPLTELEIALKIIYDE